MIRPGRSRRGPAGRGLALWLIAAQIILFSAAGLTHSHLLSPGDGDLAGALSPTAAASPTHASVQAPAHTHHGGSAHCAICQVARGTVASIATAHRVAALTTVCGQTASDLPAFVPVPPSGPCSTRAPPIA